MYVVTGASYGIGNAVALDLAKRQLPVLAVARTPQPLHELVRQFPDQITTVAADVSTADGLKEILTALRPYPSVSGLVQAAGTRVQPEAYGEINPEELVEHFRVHVAAQIKLIQAITRQAKLSRALFIDSYSASEPRDQWGAYSVVKAAAQMAARCASQELAETVCLRVFPGAVSTGVVESVIDSPSRASEAFLAMRKAGRIASPNAVASFINAILVDAAGELVRDVDAWDYNNPQHRELVNVH